MKVVQFRPRATPAAEAEPAGPHDEPTAAGLTGVARAVAAQVIQAVDQGLRATVESVAESTRTASREAKKSRRTRRWRTRLSPVDVIARALDPPRPAVRRAPAFDAVELLMRLIDRPMGGIAPAAARPAPVAVPPPIRPVPADEPVADAGFWPIWLVHRDLLLRCCLRFSGGNRADAEDALSEAMLKAAQAFPRVEVRNHRAWLLRLVHNVCMDRHRNDQRLHRLMSDIGRDGGRPVPAVVPSSNRSPEDLLAGAQLLEGLQRALASLPRSLSEPLLLYLNERSDAEIAGSLNVTKEVVRKRRQMARDWLRRQMTGDRPPID